MSELINKRCIPCEGGVPALDVSEIHKYKKKLMVGILKLMKKKLFFEKNFKLKILKIVKILLIMLVIYLKKKVVILT